MRASVAGCATVANEQGLRATNSKGRFTVKNYARAVRAITSAFLAGLIAACGSGGNRGALESATQTAAVPKAAINATVAAAPGLLQLIGTAARCDVSIRKLRYETVDPRNDFHKATAGLMIPSGEGCAGPFPVVVYHHGTTVSRSFSMSDPSNIEATLQMAMYAAQGYVVVMPDYHGYGGSTLGYHPYLHAENTAAVSIDALRAAKKALSDAGVAISAKLFLTGYSQGGHAAMSTHRAIERDVPTEFSVTAAVPMSGPYALSQTFLEALDAPVLGGSVFGTMTFVGYQKAYGDIYLKPGDFFQSPWANGIEDLIPGTLGFSELFTTGKLPVTFTGPGGLLTPGAVASYRSSAAFAARKHVADNDLLNWKPKAAIVLCGGSRDPTVPFRNVPTAVAYFATQAVAATPVDIELIPAFAAAIAAQVAAAPDLSTYHGAIVPPLCSAYAKNAVFDPLK